MDMKKGKIAGRLVDLVSIDEYVANPDAYVQSRTAIEIEEAGIALPVINRFDQSVGINIQPGNLFAKINKPDDEQMDLYRMKEVIDFSNVETITELMEKQEAVRDIEYDMLTTVDNVFQPKIGEQCTPAMKALKTAVLEKHIDIHKYQDRFGSNYNNDIRQFNKDKISLDMLERMCRCLDIKATLTLSDPADDIANPIGREITVDLIESEDMDE